MILDEPYYDLEKAFDGDQEKVNELSKSLDFIISHSAVPSYTSTNVPGVSNAIRISFIIYHDKIAFLVSYDTGYSAIKLIDKKEVMEYVFTPCLLDLVTLTPINKEDIL